MKSSRYCLRLLVHPLLSIVAVGLLLSACGGGGVQVDFSGQWSGEMYQHDLCSYDCSTITGPYDANIDITQNERTLTLAFQGYFECEYQATAEGNELLGAEVRRERDQESWNCSGDSVDEEALPIIAQLEAGTLRGRAYVERAGDDYCMLEYGCYYEFEVTRDE